MGHTRRVLKISRSLTAAALAAVAFLAGCSATGGAPRTDNDGQAGGGGVDTPRYTVAMVTHGAPGDTYWDLVRKGAEDAAKKDNIELRYSNDPEAPGQANLVQTAVDSGVDGIAVTLAKPDAMQAAVKAAEAKGIPVVAFNAGADAWSAMGVKEFFGQDEFIAGQAVGERLTGEGAKKAICVIQEQGHVGLESRCAGVKDTWWIRRGAGSRRGAGPIHAMNWWRDGRSAERAGLVIVEIEGRKSRAANEVDCNRTV